jgi:hypothetical protein
MSVNMWKIGRFAAWAAASVLAVSLAGCGGGGGNAGTPVLGGGSGGGSSGATSATLTLSASSTTVSSASPAQITAVLKDASGNPVAGQVVEFKVVGSLAVTGVGTALTNANGEASTSVYPASSTSTGADAVTASVDYAGKTLEGKVGFQFNATNITLSFDALPSGFTLSAYGQVSLVLRATGASVGSPVNISLSSACVDAGKATLSPATATMTSGSLTVQYRDGGVNGACGATQVSDLVQATVPGSSSKVLMIPLASPSVTSLGFVQAVPEQIFLKGSGLGESAAVTFVVRDVLGNAVPNQAVSLRLLTGAGGVLMAGQPVGTTITRTSDALGRVSVPISSGTVPTPVRVQASIVSEGATISTVSSNLSVAMGLPSQLNFSLSQNTINIEGFNINGTPNAYTIFAADRSGNPVPAGTSINFVTEGGQIESSASTQLVNGISRATVNFVSQESRPADGRVTITAYALGEESFLDLNGNNVYDMGEPFQDLGDVFKDRSFNGLFDVSEDEFVPLKGDSAACTTTTDPLLALNPSIPSRPNTCDGRWSDKVYVRRAVETVLSTSTGRPLWADTGGTSGGRGLQDFCPILTLQTGPWVPPPLVASTADFTRVNGQTWYTGGSSSGVLTLIVADANNTRYNPMAAGTEISATSSNGLSVTVDGGSPVPNTSQPSLTTLSFTFQDDATAGLITVTFRSPNGTTTSFPIPVNTGSRPFPLTLPASCP